MKKQNKNITKDFFTATYLFTIWFIKSFPLVLLHCFTLGITLPLPFYSIHTHHRDFYSRGEVKRRSWWIRRRLFLNPLRTDPYITLTLPQILWTNFYYTWQKRCFYSEIRRHTSQNSGLSRRRFEDTLLKNNFALNIASILKEKMNNKSFYEIQLEIEKFIFEDINTRLLTKIKSSNTLKEDSFSLLKSVIRDAERPLEAFKRSKLLLKGKDYYTCFINTDSQLIISIVLCNVIPHALKHENITRQHVTSLYLKIGSYLTREYNKTVYGKLLKWSLSLLKELETYKDIKFIDFDDLAVVDSINTLLFKNPFRLKNDKEDITLNNFISFDLFINNLHTRSFNDVDFIKYGQDMVEFISSHTNLYDINENFDYFEEKSYRFITFSDDCRTELLNLLVHSENSFPMVSKPVDWVIKFEKEGNYALQVKGGYYINNSDTHFIHNKYKNQGEVKLEDAQLIKTINYLQGIEYMINKDVLEIITDRLASGSLKDLIHIDFHPLTNKLSKLRKESKMVEVKQILSYNSSSYVNRLIITQAILLKNTPTIYFPIYVDWRGRLYSITTSFSYQGPDLAKSLFLFKNGVVINQNGLVKLKLFIAKSYGIINASNKTLLDWVDSNINNIIDIESNFWMTGKNPFSSLAASMELRGYLSDKENFISHLPIYIDATCNGIQHLASMAGATNLAEFVNLRMSSDYDIPHDLYGKMSEIANYEIKKFLIDNPDHDVIGLINMDRYFIKRCIMTIPYGISKRGVKNQLASEHFYEVSDKVFKVDPKFIDEHFKDTVFNIKDIAIVAKIIHNVLFETYPILTSLVKYIKDMNKFLYKFERNLSTFWKTPSGLVLEQKYVYPENQLIKTSILGKRKSVTLHRYKKDGLIKLSKQNSGIIPNIIHSLDAANVSLLVNKIIIDGKKINILTVHDAFATNANYIEELTYRIKMAFLAIYANKDFITTFHDNIINKLIEDGFKISECRKYFEQQDKNGEMVIIKIPKPFEGEQGDAEFNIRDDLLLSKYFVH